MRVSSLSHTCKSNTLSVVALRGHGCGCRRGKACADCPACAVRILPHSACRSAGRRRATAWAATGAQNKADARVGGQARHLPKDVNTENLKGRYADDYELDPSARDEVAKVRRRRTGLR